MSDSNQLSLALRLAKLAGKLIGDHRKSLEIHFKDDIELVTQADVAADRLICQGILNEYPDHKILSEELNPAQMTDVEHLWIIDPIDGTVNFAHQHYQVGVSIAYYFQGRAQVGVVHCPFINETFYAELGKGAWLNEQEIKCSDQNELKRALIATGFPYERDEIKMKQLIARVSTVLNSCADIRRLGSAALDICWVACGRMDAYYESVKPWDFAAAQLIAREAGATFGHIHELPADANKELWGDDLLISTPACYQPLQKLLAEASH